MKNKKLLSLLLVPLMLGAGATSSARDLQSGSAASSTKNLPSGAAAVNGGVTVRGANSVADQPGTATAHFTFNVPVRLRDMHPALAKVVVRCEVASMSAENGITEVAVPLSGGSYTGTVTVPVFNGVSRTYDGHQQPVRHHRTGESPDPAAAAIYECRLVLYDKDGKRESPCSDSNVGLGGYCPPSAKSKPGTPFMAAVGGNLP